MKGGEISVIYFIALATLGIAVGSHTHTPQYAFMIIGFGGIVYSAIVAIMKYLHKD